METRLSKSAAVIVISALLALSSGCSSGGRWHESSRESSGLAPLPSEEKRAVVQAYAARTWGWRGWFADHTWLSVKLAGADHYMVYEVVGWHKREDSGYVRIARDVPDRHWYGGAPRLLLDIRGETAATLVDRINDAAQSYPYADTYRAFPGPNSNTFTAWIAREVPQLKLNLPLRAIGKSYSLEKTAATLQPPQ